MGLYLGSEKINLNFNMETGIPVAKIGEVEYFTVASALAHAVSGDTVTMIADSNEAENILVPYGVTLDLVAFTLTCNSFSALSNAYLAGTTIKTSGIDAKIYVDQDKMFIQPNTCLPNGGYSVLPLYDTELGCYRLGRVMPRADGNDVLGLFIIGTKIEFHCNIQTTALVANSFMSNGLSDNGVKLIVRYEWSITDSEENTNTYYYDMLFNDTNIIETISNSGHYVSTIEDYTAFEIPITDLKVSMRLISSTGAEVASNEFTYASAQIS